MKNKRHGRISAAAKYQRMSWRRLHANSPRQAASKAPEPAPARIRFWLRLGIAGLLCAGAFYLGVVSLNILILGTDDVDVSQHTDTIMLVHWRPLPRRLALLSVPRDTLVVLPKRGPIKVNAVYAYGHALNGRPFALAMTRASVENLVGLKIHYVLNLRYSDFVKLVDSLGGVLFDVPRRIRYRDPTGGVNLSFESGRRLFNGTEALNYVCFRDAAEGETGSIRRQQEFFKTFLNHATRISRWPATLRAVIPFLRRAETNMSWAQALFLALEMRSVLGLPWQQAILPGRTAYVDGVAYWQPDSEAVRRLAAGLGRAVHPPATPAASVAAAATPEPETQARAEEPATAAARPGLRPAAAPAPPAAPEPARAVSLNLPKGRQPRVRVLNGCGVQGVCKRVADKLEQLKIRTLPQDITNAPSFKVSRSIVKTNRANLEWARYVAGSLGLDRNIQIIPADTPFPTVTVIVGRDYQEWFR